MCVSVCVCERERECVCVCVCLYMETISQAVAAAVILDPRTVAEVT